MSYDEIDKKYNVPKDMISCPGCGQRYGHHNTKVDTESEECSSCVKQAGYDNINLVDADTFIRSILF